MKNISNKCIIFQSKKQEKELRAKRIFHLKKLMNTREKLLYQVKNQEWPDNPTKDAIYLRLEWHQKMIEFLLNCLGID